MPEIEIGGVDRLSAQELVDLAALEQIEGARVVSPISPTGRPGTLPEVTAIIPYVNDFIPLLLTAWVVSKSQIEFKLTKSDRNGGKTSFQFSFKKDDPSKVLRSLKNFLTF